MFNNTFQEEVKLKIAEREHEAETYERHQQLGFSDRRGIKWVLGFLTLTAAILLILVLL